MWAKLKASKHEQLVAEVVEDEKITAGVFVPKGWREFYDDVEKRVSDFLGTLFGAEEATEEPMATEESMAAEDIQEVPPERKAGKRKVDATLNPSGSPLRHRSCAGEGMKDQRQLTHAHYSSWASRMRSAADWPGA